MSKPRQFILGLDAGFANIGYSFFKNLENGEFQLLAYGSSQSKKAKAIKTKGQKAVKVPVSEDDFARSQELLADLMHFCTKQLTLQKYDFSSGDRLLVAVEMPHGGSQSARASHCMGIAKGLVAAMTYYNDFDYILIKPSAVKDYVKQCTKIPHPDKADIIAYVSRRWKKFTNIKLTKLNEHEADSMVAAFIALTT